MQLPFHSLKNHIYALSVERLPQPSHQVSQRPRQEQLEENIEILKGVLMGQI